ncbi:MAG TPA: hypothetical protein P5205_21295 [Candidatus Paceibacterota bacterium]|nr:hypothetical protein [Verrucomicrobiota bacterium]HSA12899.1 hypothetical protein [Candidatus Paceibacterota bacterium]
MTFLPILERELRVRARSRAAYWTRFAVALAGMLVCVPQLMSPWPFSASANIGRGLLDAVVSAAFLVGCASCLLTADILSSERRQGTLGLLLLTRVGVFDVLMGKLGSAGLTSLCALVALLPMLMLPVIAGGVTGGEAFRKGLVLLDALFVALAAGLWASARGHEWRKTARNALIVVAAVVLVPCSVGVLCGKFGAAGADIALLSPLWTLVVAGDGMYKVAAANYWISLLLVHATGWALLAGAVFRLRRGWREDRGETSGTAPATIAQRETTAARSSHCPLDDSTNPIVWLLGRQRGLKAILWAGAIVGFSTSGVALVMVRLAGVRFYEGTARPLILGMALIGSALFAWAASRFFVAARGTGALELLLTTPLGARQIVSKQWEVLRRALLWPLVAMIAPTILNLGFFLVQQAGVVGPLPSFWLQYTGSVLIGCMHIVLQVWALCWLGMWFGLRTGSQARAIVWTVILANAIPHLITVVGWMLIAALNGSFYSGNSLSFTILLWLLHILNPLLYLGLIRFARRRLLGELATTEMPGFNLLESISATARGAASAWRKARHWTPS